jgi:hypothetical protein
MEEETTINLHDVEIGDTLVLRCGGRVIVSDVYEKYMNDGCLWWYSKSGLLRTGNGHSCYDVVAIEKKPHEPTTEEKSFKEGYEEGKRVGQITIQKRIIKQLENEVMQAERSFTAKYGRPHDSV